MTLLRYFSPKCDQEGWRHCQWLFYTDNINSPMLHCKFCYMYVQFNNYFSLILVILNTEVLTQQWIRCFTVESISNDAINDVIIHCVQQISELCTTHTDNSFLHTSSKATDWSEIRIFVHWGTHVHSELTTNGLLGWNKYICSLRHNFVSASSWDWYLSHRRPAKAQESLRIRAISPEPSMFAHIKYGSIRRARPQIRHLVPLDGL